MTLHHHFKAKGRGALFRPPTMRLYRSRVRTISTAVDPADQKYTVPSWENPAPETWWTPIKMNWASNGEKSTLQIKVILGQGTLKSFERAEAYRVNPGDRIELKEMQPGAGPEEKFVKPWFSGYVGQEAMLIQSHPDVESATIMTYGPELLLSHKVITGMWVSKTDQAFLAMKGELTEAAAIRNNVFEARLPVVMNPNGVGNAWGGDVGTSTNPAKPDFDWRLTSKGDDPYGYESTAEDNKCKVFTSPGATAGELVSEHWTAYTALRSVVEWVDDYDVLSYQRTNWDAIEATLGATPIGEVKLTGRNLLQAMNAILVPAGFGFAIEPWADSRGEHRLIVYRLRDPIDFTSANMAPVVGGNVEVSEFAGQRAMVQRVNYIRDNHNVKNHILIWGDTKITERSLDFDYNGSGVLQPAWDTDTYSLGDYDDANIIGGGQWASAAKKIEWAQRYTIVDGSNYLLYRDVFRTFAWNEDGGLSTYINDGTDPIVPTLTNFSKGADAQQAMFRPRPPTFRVKYAAAGAAAGAFEPPLVLLGIAGDDKSWVKAATGTYTLSKERCLIHFKAKDLAKMWPWKDVHTTSGADSLHKLYGHLNFATALWNSLRAAGADELRIRLTAGFPMDDTTQYELPRELDSSWPFDARVVIPMPRRWHYRDIEGEFPSDEDADINDEALDPIFDYATNARDVLEDATGHGSIVLRGLHRMYYPGKGMAELTGRNIDLSLPGRRQNKLASVYPIITGIAYHFAEGANKTELLLETGQVGLPS